MSELKDAGIMLQMIYKAIVKVGIDVASLFDELGITEDYLYSAQLRTPHEAQLLFWGAIEKISGDSNIGLRLANNCRFFVARFWNTFF